MSRCQENTRFTLHVLANVFGRYTYSTLSTIVPYSITNVTRPGRDRTPLIASAITDSEDGDVRKWLTGNGDIPLLIDYSHSFMYRPRWKSSNPVRRNLFIAADRSTFDNFTAAR
ncbi:hypothetical protein TNCV_1212771 [Trichonephila clavipes]|nr:hypothetical protein TNCV_1212771 [Trichonephila clavipes]